MGYSPWGHKESETTEQLTLSRFLEKVEERIDVINKNI